MTYCSVECQNADWDTHKTSCKPCSIYIMERVEALHSSQQWRKLIKWRPYLDDLLASMCRIDDPRTNTQLLRVYRMLVEAYKMGINSTDDPDNVYALAAVLLLDEMTELEGKMNRFSDQGLSLCDLALMKSRILGYDHKDSVVYYKRASDIAVRHVIPSVQARAFFGLGQIARRRNAYEEAVTLFRAAVVVSGQTNFDEEVHCLRALIDMLFELNSVDEAETFIQRYPRLIQKAAGPDFKGLNPMQLNYHLHSARVHDARGKTEETAREVVKMIALVNENKSSIHDWRPTLLWLLHDANKQLKIFDLVTESKSLVKSMADLARKQRMPMNGTRDGVKWREVLIQR